MTKNTPILSALNISKSVKGLPILNNVSISIQPGELKALIGPSGAGKSTFLQCLNALIIPDSGTLFFEGLPVDTSKKQDIHSLRRNVGMIFQDFNLFPHLNALENITVALRKVAGYSKAEASEKAHIELAQVGLESKKSLYPSQLSGGQKQRVAIARTLAMDPKIILLDEPTSALDPELVNEVLTVIQNLKNDGMTMIMVTHQIAFACTLASEILFMEHGTITEQGTPTELLSAHPPTKTKNFCKKLALTSQKNDPLSCKLYSKQLLIDDQHHDLTATNMTSVPHSKKYQG